MPADRSSPVLSVSRQRSYGRIVPLSVPVDIEALQAAVAPVRRLDVLRYRSFRNQIFLIAGTA